MTGEACVLVYVRGGLAEATGWGAVAVGIVDYDWLAEPCDADDAGVALAQLQDAIDLLPAEADAERAVLVEEAADYRARYVERWPAFDETKEATR